MSQNIPYQYSNIYHPYVEPNLQYNYQPAPIQTYAFQPYNQYQQYQQYNQYQQNQTYNQYQPYNHYQQTNDIQLLTSTQTTLTSLENPTKIM